MAGTIHIVEQGDGWEVWRQGDSMPLGSYVTQGEAEEHARSQAEIDGVPLEEHELDVEVPLDAGASDAQTGTADR